MDLPTNFAPNSFVFSGQSRGLDDYLIQTPPRVLTRKDHSRIHYDYDGQVPVGKLLVIVSLDVSPGLERTPTESLQGPRRRGEGVPVRLRRNQKRQET